MKRNTLLTITSLLSMLLAMFHVVDDIMRGWDPGSALTLAMIPICTVWLYGTLMLTGRRSGYLIILLTSLLSLIVPYLHIGVGKGIGATSRIANTSGAFFFVWTLIALGTTALFSVILSARGLWNPEWGQSRSSAG